MTTDTPPPNGVQEPPPMTGTYADAERLRQWSFLQRTPQQRLDWLISVLKIAYASGALRVRQPTNTHARDPE